MPKPKAKIDALGTFQCSFCSTMSAPAAHKAGITNSKIAHSRTNSEYGFHLDPVSKSGYPNAFR